MQKLTAYLGLGGNLGERRRNLRQVLTELAAVPGMILREISSFYETTPWGKADQPDFINAAAEVEFSGTPENLLAVCMETEKKMGRVRHEKWGPRTVDIDILHIENITRQSSTLALPHPYLTERAFVLAPLKEIAPCLKIAGKSVAEHWAHCPDNGTVKTVSGSPRDFDLKIIACVDGEGGLGYKNGLLFELPKDKEFFRAQTEGHIVIMGANTRRSLPDGLPLKNRLNMVLSRSTDELPGFILCRDTGDLWTKLANLGSSKKCFVIGGADIFRQLMPYANEILLTRAEAIRHSDVYFPALPKNFILADSQKTYDRSEQIVIDFCRYIRRTAIGNIS